MVHYRTTSATFNERAAVAPAVPGGGGGGASLPGVETRWPRRGALTGTQRDFEALFAAKRPPVTTTAAGSSATAAGTGGGGGDSSGDARLGGKGRTYRILSTAVGNEAGSWKASSRRTSNKRTVFAFGGKDWDLTDLKEIALGRTSISKMTPAFTLIVESDKFDTFLTKGTIYARWFVRTLVVEKTRSTNKLGMMEIRQQTRRTSGLSEAAKHMLFGGQELTAEQCTAGRNAALKEFAFAYCFLLLFVSSHSQAPAKERMYFEYIYIFSKEIIATILGLPSFANTVGIELERLFRSGLFQSVDAGAVMLTAAPVAAATAAGGAVAGGMIAPGGPATAVEGPGVSDFRIAKLLGTSRDVASAGGARKAARGGGAGVAARSNVRSATAGRKAPAARGMSGGTGLNRGLMTATGGVDAGAGGSAAAAAAAWAAIAGSSGLPSPVAGATVGGWIKSEEGHHQQHYPRPMVVAAHPAAAAAAAATTTPGTAPSGVVIDPYVAHADADDAGENEDDARHHDEEDEPETQSRPIRSAALRERERLRRRKVSINAIRMARSPLADFVLPPPQRFLFVQTRSNIIGSLVGV
ncbi:hypothetical protein HDU87_007611 [Geranomyces variabilis]|uniref:Uncharacterized protein n=1 Tax=Geranomyces variabilis TaxID=109894 RepID=A0AAD5TJF0_9FUNG|nr:hypothetical protein HDU87_007611 [Geranomyces variabilis]